MHKLLQIEIEPNGNRATARATRKRRSCQSLLLYFVHFKFSTYNAWDMHLGSIIMMCHAIPHMHWTDVDKLSV